MNEDNESREMNKLSLFLCVILTLDLIANLVIIANGYYKTQLIGVIAQDKQKEVVKDETVDKIEYEMGVNAYKLCDSLDGKGIKIEGEVEKIDSDGTMIKLHTDKKGFKVELVCDKNNLKKMDKNNKQTDSKLGKSIKGIKVGETVKFIGNVKSIDSKQLTVKFNKISK